MDHTPQTGRYRQPADPITSPGEDRHSGPHGCGLRVTAPGRHRVCRCQPTPVAVAAEPAWFGRALGAVLARLRTAEQVNA